LSVVFGALCTTIPLMSSTPSSAIARVDIFDIGPSGTRQRQVTYPDKCLLSSHFLPGVINPINKLQHEDVYVACVGYSAKEGGDFQIGFTGSVEAGETTEAAMIREGREELGLDCSNGILVRSPNGMNDTFVVDCCKVVPVKSLLPESASTNGVALAAIKSYILLPKPKPLMTVWTLPPKIIVSCDSQPAKSAMRIPTIPMPTIPMLKSRPIPRKVTGLICGSQQQLIDMLLRPSIREKSRDQQNIDHAIILHISYIKQMADFIASTKLEMKQKTVWPHASV